MDTEIRVSTERYFREEYSAAVQWNLLPSDNKSGSATELYPHPHPPILRHAGVYTDVNTQSMKCVYPRPKVTCRDSREHKVILTSRLFGHTAPPGLSYKGLAGTAYPRHS